MAALHECEIVQNILKKLPMLRTKKTPINCYKNRMTNNENEEEKGTRREGESCAEHHSCGEQADSAQQSKHTAGFPERRRALEMHQPPGPHHQSCWQMHPSNLLLSTTFNRKTASHYPGQGVCWFPGVTPSASGRYPQGLYSQVCLPLELPLLWTTE